MLFLKQSTKIFVGVLIIVVAVGYLMFSGFSNFAGYQVTITDLVAGEEDYDGEYLMVPGKLVGDSVKFDGDKVQLAFTVTDGKNKLPVIYNDVKPDNFDDATEVILEGFYDKEENVFKAEKLTTKCPSKYEAGSIEEMNGELQK